MDYRNKKRTPPRLLISVFSFITWILCSKTHASNFTKHPRKTSCASLSIPILISAPHLSLKKSKHTSTCPSHFPLSFPRSKIFFFYFPNRVPIPTPCILAQAKRLEERLPVYHNLSFSVASLVKRFRGTPPPFVCSQLTCRSEWSWVNSLSVIPVL